MTDTAPSSLPANADEVLCPLCEYNLRGLTDARCPECGAKFDWEELRDPSRRLHPYLFEHHPERNIRSFWRTLIGGLRPRQFWTTLYPTQPSRLRRLFLYFLIYSIIGALCAVLMLGIQMYGAYIQIRQQSGFARAQLTRYFNGAGTGIHPGVPTTSPSAYFHQLSLRIQNLGWMNVASDEEVQRIVHQYGSVQNYIDQQYPKSGSWGMIWQSFRWASRQGRALSAIPGSDIQLYALQLSLIGWPIIVALSLMMLRATMRAAKVRPSHLLRVGIYCGDAIAWLGALTLIPLALEVWENWTRLSAGLRGSRSAPWVATLNEAADYLPLLGLAWLTYRLGVALVKYLRFRHAIATAIAVQIIFVLLALKICFIARGM